MKPRNPTLYRNLKQFTEEAINLIRERAASGKDIPTRLAYELETRKEGLGPIRPVEKPHWGLLIHPHEPELVQLDSYASCMRLLQADAVIAPHLDKVVGIDRGEATIVRTTQILPNFLGSLLAQSESLTFEQDRFDALYNRMENFFCSQELHFRIIAPLINARGPDEQILLADKVYIAPNPVTRLEQWITRFREMAPNIPWLHVPELTHSLECQFAAPKVIGPSTSPMGQGQPAQAEEPPLSAAVAKITQMVRALRLLKRGYVAVPFIEHQMVEWHPQPSVGWQAPLYPPHWRPFDPRYVIQESEAQEISSLYHALSYELAKKHRAINVALHRIDRSVEETEPVECLVDLVIALEALLLADTGDPEYRGELGFRLALRGAYFLARNPRERVRIYDELRNAYLLRSKVVHGGDVPTKVTILSRQVPAKEFVAQIEDHVRETAKRMLLLAARPDAPKPLVNWDKLVLGVTGLDNKLKSLD